MKIKNIRVKAKKISLGVSICLDVVSIETLDLNISKTLSRHFKKVSLDDWDRDFSILSWGREICQDLKIFGVFDS